MITDNNYTPKTIAENAELKFSIPLYQRLFAWGESEITQLLDDLVEHFKMRGSSPYYIGMLTVINDANTKSLIDGQQRFTVMIILGICLKEYYTEWGQFIGSNKLHFTARSEDQDYITYRANNLEDRPAYINEKMEIGINTIKKYIDDKVVEPEKFAENVYENLTFFLSELPDNYSKYPSSLNRYFEIMNSEGRSLEQHEILKVNMLRDAGSAAEGCDIDLMAIWNAVCQMDVPLIKLSDEEEDSAVQKYREAINECENGQYKGVVNMLNCKGDGEKIGRSIIEIEPQKYDFKKQNKDSKYGSIIDFPEFLLFVLFIIKNGDIESYKKYELDSIFRDVFKGSAAVNFFKEMLRYRLLFDLYVVKRDMTTLGGGYTIMIDDDDNRLKQFQSMLFVSTDSLIVKFNWLKCLIDHVSENNSTDSTSILKELKAYDNNLHKIESINVCCWSYEKRNIDRYWFWRLDYYLWERRKELISNINLRSCIDNYIFRRNRSIEHLYPQNDEKQSLKLIEKESLIHSFGNLAMISIEFNSTQSDDPVDVKFARIKSQADKCALQSIKLYHMYMTAETDANKWGPEVINKHVAEMESVLLKSYEISD